MSNTRKTILVVEDERPLLEVVQIKLEGGGFDVVTARSVGQALEFLKEVPKTDAIWLDHYLLGEQDGLHFVSKIKEDSKTKDLPIFVISNSASEDTKQAYLKMGVAGYYVKSDFRLDEIIEDIRTVLRM